MWRSVSGLALDGDGQIRFVMGMIARRVSILWWMNGCAGVEVGVWISA